MASPVDSGFPNSVRQRIYTQEDICRMLPVYEIGTVKIKQRIQIVHGDNNDSGSYLYLNNNYNKDANEKVESAAAKIIPK